MKNKILFGAVLFAFCTHSMNISAQLKVAENGNVGISTGTYTPLSKLTIGETAGLSTARLYVYGSGNGGANQYGIYSNLLWGSNAVKCAIYGYTKGAGGSLIGVKGEAEADGINVTVPIYGVYGIAGGGSTGKNYGVFGALQSGTSNGAGIYGTDDGLTTNIAGLYAAYFRGETNVNGNLCSVTSYQTSDARLKRNITDIQSDAIQKIKDLHPVQYQLQQVEDVVTVDTVTIKTPHFSSDIDLEQKHYGLLAQDVQKLFPDLVQEGGDGYLSINYVELIPLLIQAVQELSAKVEELEKTK